MDLDLFLSFIFEIFLRKFLGNFRKHACRYRAILKEWKRHEYLCPSSPKWSLLTVSFVGRFCLSVIACRRLWPGSCKLLRCIRFPQVGSGRRGGGVSLTVSYRVLSWLMVRFLLRHYPLILISKQINLLTLKTSKRNNLLQIKSVHISKFFFMKSAYNINVTIPLLF